ncbi:hypothetical protein DYB32_006399 [Aphanomyces invadans]|uniref:Uncharacterized protein n=1 Tax=Aphanomyces invadans TaxID=157072 RepID=A0A418AS87_9STRA|nr:hypothetical protein DYB32_006399 [Aphanomyces invadans]
MVLFPSSGASTMDVRRTTALSASKSPGLVLYTPMHAPVPHHSSSRSISTTWDTTDDYGRRGGGVPYSLQVDTSSSVDDSMILKDDYIVDTILEEGALVPGGALQLWSMEACALYAQYASIGIVYGMLPQLAYPVYAVYLRLEGYQVSSYSILVNMAWSLKIFFGMASDCIPIGGYRRKPWMVLGWLICFGNCLFMALYPFSRPYCDPPATDLVAVAQCQNRSYPPNAPFLNKGAHSNLYTFIVPSMLASVGYVMSACASDAMVVQYAQREPAATRGRTQTAIYVVRTMATIVSQLVVGFCLNGREYGGEFSFSLPMNVIYAFLCIPCVLVTIVTVFAIHEHKTERVPFAKYMGGLWSLLQKQALWQIMAFRFLSNMFQGFSSTAIPTMSSEWVQLWPVVDSVSTAFGSVIFASIMTVVGKYGLQWNWRWTIALSTLGLVSLDSVVYMATIWDVYRNQWFFTGVVLADNIPTGVRFIVSIFCAVEIADLGIEGTVYGLVTTVNNLATPVAGVLYKWIDAYFKVTSDDIKTDTTEIRWHVTYTFLIAYAMKVLSLGWLFLLPPQKAHLQRLKKYGHKSPVAGAAAVVLFLAFLVFSITTNLMSIFSSTRCYRIAGGKGCDQHVTDRCVC